MDTASSEDNFQPSPSPASEDEADLQPKINLKKRSRGRTTTSQIHAAPTRSSSSRIIPDFTRPVKRRCASDSCPDSYQRLLEEIAAGTDKLAAEFEEEPYDTSYVGVSRWTGEEKGRFFKALDLYGRDDVLAIAEEVDTKSQPEIEAYIKCLQEEAAKLPYSLDVQAGAEYTASTTAVDVSQYCESRVVAAAETLAAQELDEDENIERSQYGMAWLLDESLVSAITYADFRVDRLLQPLGTDAEEPLNALDFFDLPMMLRLSMEYFMRSHDPEWSYVTHADAGEMPSIRLSALVELYDHVAEFTDRLIFTAHHCALSRIKALEPYYSHRRDSSQLRKIKPTDVHAALDILRITSPHLHTSLGEYWKDFRNKLGDEDCQKPASLDVDLDMDSDYDTDPCRDESTNISSTESASDDSYGSTQSEQRGETMNGVGDGQDEPEDSLILKIEEHKERLDASAGDLEQARLLQACGLSLPERTSKRRLEVLVSREITDQLPQWFDWRSDIDYQALWERYSERFDSPSDDQFDVGSVNQDDESRESSIVLYKEHTERVHLLGITTDTLSAPPAITVTSIQKQHQIQEVDDEMVIESVEMDQPHPVSQNPKARDSTTTQAAQGQPAKREASRNSDRGSVSSRWSSHDPDSPTHLADLYSDGHED